MENDTVLVNYNHYHLVDLKRFLIKAYPVLVTNSAVRAIAIKGVVSFTYDWKEIFRRCENTVLPLYEFTRIAIPIPTARPCPEQLGAAPILNNADTNGYRECHAGPIRLESPGHADNAD